MTSTRLSSRLFRQFLRTPDARLPASEASVLVRRLTDHLGRESQGLPVVTEFEIRALIVFLRNTRPINWERKGWRQG